MTTDQATLDSPDLSLTVMEDAVSTWGERLESVVRQEVERAREVTHWARGELETEGRGTATIAQKTV